MASRDDAWTRDEQLVALRLYLTEPFGKLHKRNPRIVRLAAHLGTRSPGALAMKACNFASLDPTFRATGRKGLRKASDADRALWGEFSNERAKFIKEMDAVFAPTLLAERREPTGLSEAQRLTKVRRHQWFFREEVLAAYEGRCAITQLDVPELLVASHIIPWKDNEERRTDPSNGVLLNALFDRAFDRGLISFDDSLRVLCSKRLDGRGRKNRTAILEFRGVQIRPKRCPPDLRALAWHRERWGFAA